MMKKLTGKWRLTLAQFAVSVEVQEYQQDPEQAYWREAKISDLWARVRNKDKVKWQCVR
ncbi:hypothetical protein [Motilimonas eburnea]|uniref:hypothetical protein n=1 Tax=Motilimonas eburnea TaxID=1737488 RepID=UPI001E580317|nr:hypothetical protein [Motilimonas eburnea]MCE2570878.1 hypothetical protein [Motilimonas eburnea]